MRHFLLVLFVLKYSFAFSQSYTSFFTGDTADVNTSTQFGLCLMGGATEEDHAMRWFLQKSGGGDVVVLRTTGGNGYNAYLYSQLGISVNSVETILFNNATAAYDPYVLRRITGAEAIFIAGGDQSTYMQYWRGTPVESLINYLSAIKKVPIGGTSAGMAILGWSFNSATAGSVTSAQALSNPFSSLVTVEQNNFLKLSFMQKTITDTHYDNPDRRGRHIVFLSRMMAANGDTVRGIACDEYTAVCIDSMGIARAFGSAPIYDDNAYFLQVNPQLPNNPEILVSGTPLTWDRNHAAIKVYNIKADTAGSKTFDMNTWCLGTGGTWQNWYVQNGVLSTTAGTGPCNALPLNFLQISASEKNKKVLIEWKVAQQINVKQYEVQRNTPTGNFETIKIIEAKKNNSDAITYQFVDNQPTKGNSFYRIRSEDKSGEYQFSPIAKVTFNFFQSTIFPNPVTDKLSIRFVGHAAGKYVLRLVNAQGQSCYSSTFDCNGATVSKVIHLPSSVGSGRYAVQLLDGNQVIMTEKVIIIR